MNGHVDFDDLQDFREGLLAPDRHESVRAHLEGCPECRREMEALTVLMEDVGSLPTEARPSRDLWPQIEWRIAGGGREASPLGASGRARRPGRQVTLQAWQLLAAGIALVVFSGSGVWAVLSRAGGVGEAVPAASAPRPATLAEPAGWEPALSEYHQAVAELERVLDMGRDVLDPETIGILEENLETIDGAIREARDALAQDPGSAILGRFLAENLRRKIDLLRRAATVIYQNT